MTTGRPTLPAQPHPVGAAVNRSDPVEAALLPAEATGQDGRPRALDHLTGSQQALERLARDVRDAIRDAPPGSPARRTLAWAWRTISQGEPMTAAGRVCGRELRLSPRTRAYEAT